MSAQDREKFLALKQRNKELEMQMEGIAEVIAQLKANESAADSKIKALNNIHSEKIRSLMNSIQLLKKENMQLEKLQKEHKRSELISQLQKDVSDQDTIIETLRSTCKIRNITEEVLDAAIIEALTKGPPRIRALTREELKIEIKKLKSQVDGLKKSKANQSNPADGNNNKQNNQNKDQEQLEDDENELNKSHNQNNQSMMSQQHEPADSNENLIRRLEELKSESDELRLHLKASEQVVERYEQQLESKSEELNDLKSAKTDFLVLTKKYETLQLQFEQLKAENNKKFMSQYDKELKLEEMEIVAKTQSDKLKMQEENLQLEIDAMSAKLEDAVQRHDQTKRDYEDLRIRYETLNTAHQKEVAKNKELNAKFSILSAEHEKLQVKYQTETKALTKQIDVLAQKLSKSEEQTVALSAQVEGLHEQVNQLTIENEDYKTKIIAGQGLKFEGRNWAFGREGLNDASAETKELREKIRAMSDKEVDLLDELESLKEQKRFYEQRQLAQNILNQKDKAGGVDKSLGQDTFKKQQINIVRREYETKLTDQRLKIKELQEQIEHLAEMFTWVGQEQQPQAGRQQMKDQEDAKSIIVNESDLDISGQQSNGGAADNSGISDLKQMEEKIAQGENKALKLKLTEAVQRQNDLQRQIEYYRQQSGQNSNKNDQIRDERLQEMKIGYQKKVKDYQEKITQLELKEINLNEISSQISDILSQKELNISPSILHNLSSDVFLSLSDLPRLGDQNNQKNTELNVSQVDSRISDIISRDEKHLYSREIDSISSSISNLSNMNNINQKSNKKILGKPSADNKNIFQKTTQKQPQPFSRENSDIGSIIGVGAGQNNSSLENLSISSGISQISKAANNPNNGNKNNKKDFRIRQNSSQSVNSSIGSILNNNQNNYQTQNNNNGKQKKDDNLSQNLDDVSSNIDDLDL